MKLYTFRSFQKVKQSAVYLSIAALFIAAPFLSALPVNAAAPTLVQGRANSIGSGTNVNQSFINSNTAGNLIAVYVIWSNTSTATVTDSRNTFTAVAPASKFSNNQWSSQVFYAKNIGAGANTVRATFGTSVNSFGLIYIHEFSGVDKINPLDVTVAATGSSGALNSGAAVTTNANDLLFAAGASSNSLAAISPNFTSAINFDGNRTAYKNVTTTGSYSATAAHSGNAWAMHLVAFRAANSTPPVDTTPPVRTNGAPTGTLPSSTTSTTISLVTNELASCKYATTAGTPYASMVNGFTTSNNVNHAATVNGLAAGQSYTYYVRCIDQASPANANTNDYSITFSVAAPTSTAPVLTNGAPTGSLPATTTSATLSLTSDVNATCKYSTTAGIAYAAMPNTFTTTGGTNHTTGVSGLSAGQSYNYFVRCIDTAGNANTTDYLIAFSVAPTSGGAVAWPLKHSPNHRYLVDQNNAPFLMVGDSPQGIIGSLNTTDSETYFANRETNGFNTVWINLLTKGTTGGQPSGNTPDGIAPFNVPGDLSSHNDAYFQRVEDMVTQAANHNILVVLDPIETMDHLNMLRANGAVKAHDYGVYLGNRFRNFPNIIWMYGNDYTPTTSDNFLLTELARGIKEADNPSRLQTVEIYPTPNASYDDSTWIPLIDLDLVYMYNPAFQKVLGEYNRSADPVFMIESHYDFEEYVGNPHQPDLSYRKQEFWTMLSGGAGYVYGNYYTVYLDGGWQTHLNTPAVRELGYLKNLFNSVAWYNLVPDQTHTFLTAGFGAWDGGFEDNSYATAAVTADGSLGMVYMPSARNITINMAKMNGSTTARWFDPTTGTYTAIGTYPNTGTRIFTPPQPGHADGKNDWVLVLQTTPSAP